MNARDFCYWLQGAFEITGIKSFSEKQLSIVSSHLALVDMCEKDKSMKHEAYRFCVVLQDAIDNRTLDVQSIIERLNNVFQHEIDPSFSGNQEELNFAHHSSHGGASFDKDVKLRC